MACLLAQAALVASLTAAPSIASAPQPAAPPVAAVPEPTTLQDITFLQVLSFGMLPVIGFAVGLTVCVASLGVRDTFTAPYLQWMWVGVLGFGVLILAVSALVELVMLPILLPIALLQGPGSDSHTSSMSSNAAPVAPGPR